MPERLHFSPVSPEHLRFAGRFRRGIALGPPVTDAGKQFYQLGIIPWLDDEVISPAFHSFHGQGDVGIGGKQHNRHFRPSFLYF